MMNATTTAEATMQQAHFDFGEGLNKINANDVKGGINDETASATPNEQKDWPCQILINSS